MTTRIERSFQYGRQTVTLETGRIARQATGAVLVTAGDTVVLATVVASPEAKPQNFLPLSVHYQEKIYAAGRIPGGYFRREGRPTEKETLTSRLIDRPLRPLFPEGFRHEVQVICTVLSADHSFDPDIAAMIGASAAMAVAKLPCAGPVAAARVGYHDQKGYILNPSYEEQREGRLDMVVAGTVEGVQMVESGADQLSEEVMLGAVNFAHEKMQPVIENIVGLAEAAGRPEWSWQPPPVADQQLVKGMEKKLGSRLADAYALADKQERNAQLAVLKQEAREQFAGEDEALLPVVDGLFKQLGSDLVRERILSGQSRMDGRDARSVRDIEISLGLLPKTHGSALFTRGETQALVTCTLGTARDVQMIESLEGQNKEGLLFHYNFPPYSVGECGRMMGASRREIGHGRLARRAISNMLPADKSKFPYTLRLVSEITESNGSSSMASVCGASLALMDAGVAIKAQVAGVAMGLVKEGDRFVVLTDILGDEDHLGDMDFKVAGTENGVTALQMDIKIAGIDAAIMEAALQQANEARLHILERMNEAIDRPRPNLSPQAPCFTSMQIGVDKIRDVIGKGGATIRSITEETGAQVEVEQDGTVRIYGENAAIAQEVVERIKSITAEVEIGTLYEGKVQRVVEFGAFVNLLPGKDGLVHISQIADRRIDNIYDVLEEGQVVKVKVLDIDAKGRVKLTMRGLHQERVNI